MKIRRKAQKSYLQVIMAALEWFYRETGIAVTVFDREGEPIAHFGGGVDICRYIRLKLCKKCRDCDKDALTLLLNGHDCCEYLCHAGLSEAAALVRSEDGDFDGYIIIGKYLSEETLEASKRLLQALSDEDVDVSAVHRAAKGLIPLGEEERKHALCCLSAVARRFEEAGCLKGFRDPDIRHAIQMVNRDGKKATCITLYEEIYATRQSAKTIFVKHCGESPSAFLTQRKMIRAEDLLMNTDASVGEIADSLGYDLCAFTTFFKRQYGGIRQGISEGMARRTTL